MEPKIGVYICSGCGIGESTDTAALAENVKKESKPAICRVDGCVCAADFLTSMGKDIAAEGINRVVIGACSGRYFTERFDFGPEVLVERVALRELAVWTAEPKAATTQETAQ